MRQSQHLIWICLLLILLCTFTVRGDEVMSLFARGIQELNAGRLDAALETFKQVTTTAPDFADGHYHLGLVYYEKGQFGAAAAAFEQTLKFLPRDVEALIHLGLACYKAAGAGQSLALRDVGIASGARQAVKAYRTALEIQPHNVKALNNLGLAYQALGQFDEAITAYQEALLLSPHLREVAANLATARDLQRGTYSLAAYKHYRTGMQLKRAGNSEAAVAAWKQAIGESPRYLQAHLQLAESYFEGGAYERAISAYLSALELRPDAADIFYNLGNSYLYTGKLESAVAAYQRAVEIHPKMASAWANMGTVLLELERIDAAIAACEKALEIVPAARQIQATLTTAQGIKSGQWTTQAYRLWQRGIAAANRGDTQTAIALWRQAVALSPNYAQAHESLGWTYFTLQRFDDAVQACQAAQTSFAVQLITFARELKAGKYPFRAYQLWEQGRRASAAGELEQAVAYLSQAIAEGPAFVEAHNTLAWLYADKLGTNLAAAEKLARRAILLSGGTDMPGRPHLHHTLGWVLYKQGRYAEALNAFEEALRHSPNNAAYLYHASLAALKNSRPPQALAYLAQAIAEDARWVETARTQREFDAIRWMPRFRALIP